MSQDKEPSSQDAASPSDAELSLASDRQVRPDSEGSRASAHRGVEDSQPEFRPRLEEREIVHGKGLGNVYVRIRWPMANEFQPHGEGVLEATPEVLRPRTSVERGMERLKRFAIGDRLATSAQAHERLTKVKGLAVLSSDAISSVAYATEASLGILILAGVGALHYNLGIAAAIVLLMIIVGVSYRQTIGAYPHGGGSYIVARDNLGIWPGLVAAAALLIDYVLTVSVSVSAGVDALTTAFSALHPFSVVLGVTFVAIIVVVNLRGIRESGTIFAAPTYLFIVSFLIMILAGVTKAALTPGGLFTPTAPLHTAEELGWGSQQLSLLLILTAFASGCSAMTGVEAISNGVPAFKVPEARNAARTLEWMIAVLATLFVGITFLAWRFGIVPYPNQQPTVDGQIAQIVFTGGFRWMYYVVQFATLLILVLAANTSFADFPRLASILARDGFLPRQFSFRGDRLAFTVGIIVLGLLSTLLIVIFAGNTDALINLYALGVFVAFTLSQTGMVVRWYRRRTESGSRWRRSLVVNLVGATATGIVAIVIGITKFERGAWVVVLIVPLLVLMFTGIARHYAAVETETQALTPIDVADLRHVIIVPLDTLSQPGLQALAYAWSITHNVVAVHIGIDAQDERKFRQAWTEWSAAQAQRSDAETAPLESYSSPVHARTPDRVKGTVEGAAAPRYVIIESPYRSLVSPLVAYVEAVREMNKGATITVILPEFVTKHWWEALLHNQTAFRIKLALYRHPGVVVTNVPYHLES
jgi:amino acid transporter